MLPQPLRRTVAGRRTRIPIRMVSQSAGSRNQRLTKGGMFGATVDIRSSSITIKMREGMQNVVHELRMLDARNGLHRCESGFWRGSAYSLIR